MAGKKRIVKEIGKIHFDRKIIIKNRNKLIMEGCDKIIECDREKIILEGEHRVSIIGKKLRLMEIGNQNMAVGGIIDSLVFEDRKNG